MRRAVVACALLGLWASPATAQMRSRFEPGDLEIKDTGTLEIDAQLSATQGESAGRVIVPDFEIALGLAPNVQLEVDGAYAVEGRPQGKFSLDHSAPDNLWVSSKLRLFDLRDRAARTAWAGGLQLGPKLPLAPSARGAGYEAIALVGRTIRRTHLVLNAGALLDPGPSLRRGRPAGIEGGLDLDLDLDARDELSLVGELGGVAFISRDPHQLHATLGLAWQASKNLQLSLVGLVGLLGGGDRYGALLGVAPSFDLF